MADCSADVVVEFELAVTSAAEEDTQAMEVKICNPKGEDPLQNASCERVPKCSAACLGLLVQGFYRLRPPQLATQRKPL